MQLDKTYELPFPISEVYSAWVSSDTVIPPATKRDVLPLVGGHYRLLMETDDMTLKNEGVFSIVVPEQQVVYTWEWNNDGEVSTIDVRFIETAFGTRIELTHSGFEKAESVDQHDSGWDSYIEGFTAHLKEKGPLSPI